MAGYKVEICGVNTSKLPLLTNEEKTDLFRRIQNGDTDAREIYIKGNLRLVLSVIQRFSGSSENIDDLFQIGCIRLIKAIDNFDLSQNVKYSTYAADEGGISKEEITYAMDAIQSPVSLYEPVYTDGGDPLCVMDQISDKKNREENWVEQLSLSEAMKRLPARERKIIDMRFFEGKTQTEVAGEVGISQAQVSRLEKNALKSMRNYLN